VPGNDSYRVATGALRSEGDLLWGQAANDMRAIATEIEALSLASVDLGVTCNEILVPAHEELVELLSRRCADGAMVMEEIWQTLYWIAKQYEASERYHQDAFQRLQPHP
jgi:hypothetical protein